MSRHRGIVATFLCLFIDVYSTLSMAQHIPMDEPWRRCSLQEHVARNYQRHRTIHPSFPAIRFLAIAKENLIFQIRVLTTCRSTYIGYTYLLTCIDRFTRYPKAKWVSCFGTTVTIIPSHCSSQIESIIFWPPAKSWDQRRQGQLHTNDWVGKPRLRSYFGFCS